MFAWLDSERHKMDPAKSPPLPQLPQSPSTSQPFACNLCHQRKVKCDRLVPCANCKKSQITCEYREGRKSRPLKRKFSDELARYQDALQHHKYPTYAPYHADDRPAESTERESHAPPTPGPPKGGNVTQPEHNGDGGRFMKEDGKLRYIETYFGSTSQSFAAKLLTVVAPYGKRSPRRFATSSTNREAKILSRMCFHRVCL